MNESLYLFENEKINVEIEFKNKAKEKRIYPLKFIINDMLKFLYRKEPSWVSVKAWWKNSGAPIGLLVNDSKSLELKDRRINKFDWVYFANEDHDLLAIVYFKKSDLKVDFQIKKSDLVNNFVTKLYDNYENKWEKFDTFFSDSGNIAYTEFYNSYHRRKNHRISPMTLGNSLLNLKIDSHEEESFFYCIYFVNKPYYKIGYTTNFRFRIFNYLYPSSSNEVKLYKDAQIDFEKSFVIKSQLAVQIETKLKKELKDSIFKIEGYNSNEIFHVSTYNKLLSLNDNYKNSFKELFEYGSVKQLKEEIIASGIDHNPLRFFKKKGTSNFFLNGINKKIK